MELSLFSQIIQEHAVTGHVQYRISLSPLTSSTYSSDRERESRVEQRSRSNRVGPSRLVARRMMDKPPTAFQSRVYDVVRTIPKGSVRSYGSIATGEKNYIDNEHQTMFMHLHPSNEYHLHELDKHCNFYSSKLCCI